MTRPMVAACSVAMLGVLVLAVGTPYNESKSFVVPPGKLDGAERLKVQLELPRANLRVAVGDELAVTAEAEGFGSPGSRLEDRDDFFRDGQSCEFRLRQEKDGFFASLEQVMSLSVLPGIGVDGEIALEKGVLVVDFGDGMNGSWDLELGKVDLTLLVPEGLELKIELAEGLEVPAVQDRVGLGWDEKKRRWKRGEEPSVKVRIKAYEEGEISFIPSGEGR